MWASGFCGGGRVVVRGVGEEKVVAAEATTAAGVTVEQKPGVFGFNTFF